VTCDTARDIWVSIENQYQQNSIERRQALQQQFLNVTFNSEHGVRAHIKRIKLLAKDLTEAGCVTRRAEHQQSYPHYSARSVSRLFHCMGEHSHGRKDPRKSHDETLQ